MINDRRSGINLLPASMFLAIKYPERVSGTPPFTVITEELKPGMNELEKFFSICRSAFRTTE